MPSARLWRCPYCRQYFEAPDHGDPHPVDPSTGGPLVPHDESRPEHGWLAGPWHRPAVVSAALVIGAVAVVGYHRDPGSIFAAVLFAALVIQVWRLWFGAHAAHATHVPKARPPDDHAS